MPPAAAKQRVTVPPGLVVVDKPDGMTSHDVVAKVRRIMSTRKVGHAGTLDPMATGVLVLGIERATKLLGHLALDTKAYLATIRLGSATTTDDAQGETLSTSDASAVTDEAIKAGIAKLTGHIQQVPSAVSAIKVDGKRAYARVRAGEQVELAARPVEVSRFDLLSARREDGLELDVMVECSSGTYVRALARDLGADLGVGGHLAALRRTRVGPFDLRVVTTLEKLAENPVLSLPLDEAVAAAFPRHDVPYRQAKSLLMGQRLPAAGIEGTYGVFDPEGRAIALAVDEGPAARSVVVLITA
ncbi:tRNA pseudouridine55 synthase [Actinophytocola algeriensis]|uniref:tRNA pseudouridine synthase B n=2 Tax=Actinophytocola algeriensis TaxID=1768010 RepID=A0A7W7QBC0_9PSEU|nr:tRNA pseudouridine55 synthase [Actinophytocola algeriensis]MBE1480591.1 tRNA pseudouridine55 synthase [Actinophytocola algeriensis]